MTNFKDNRNDTLAVYQVQQSKGYVDVATFGGLAIAVASGTSAHAAISTAAVITTAITNPDIARVPRIVGAGADHDATGNVVIIGKDVRGNTVSQSIALNSNTAVDGTKAIKSMTSIDTTGVTGLDATATVTVGYGVAIGLGRLQTFIAPLVSTTDGVADTLPTITKSSTDISLNTVTFATAPNASHVYSLTYVTQDLYAGV